MRGLREQREAGSDEGHLQTLDLRCRRKGGDRRRDLGRREERQEVSEVTFKPWRGDGGRKKEEKERGRHRTRRRGMTRRKRTETQEATRVTVQTLEMKLQEQALASS